MKELVCLAVFVILSGFFAILMILAGFVFQYKNNCENKNTTYECGVNPIGNAEILFDVKYFYYAVLFLIFDVETVFLYPFALSVNKLGLFALVEAFLFIGLLFLGLIFAVKQKLLRWL